MSDPTLNKLTEEIKRLEEFLNKKRELLAKAEEFHISTGADVLVVVHSHDMNGPAYGYASPKLLPMITQAHKSSVITQLLASKENSNGPVILPEGGPPPLIDLNDDIYITSNSSAHNDSNASCNETLPLQPQSAADPLFRSPVHGHSNPLLLTNSMSPVAHSQLYISHNPTYSSPVVQSPLKNRQTINHLSPMHQGTFMHNNSHQMPILYNAAPNSSSPQWNHSTESSNSNTIQLQSTKVLAGSLPSTPPFSLTNSPSSASGSSSIGLEVNLRFLHAFKTVHKLHLTPEEKTQVVNLICANNQILLAAFEAFSSQTEEDIKYLTQAAKNLINNQCAL